MADILSQDEVDALLNAVTDGQVPAEEGADAPAATGVVSGSTHVSRYDFRRPDRVSKEQFRGLQTLADSFARDLSTSLSVYLRLNTRVFVTSIDQLTYDEFILSIANPTCFNVIDCQPLEGNAVLELSPQLVFPVVERLLGGKGTGLERPRELTEIEKRIILKIINIALTTLAKTWGHLADFQFSVVAQESDPQIVQIVTGSEIVILVGFEIHVGDMSGSMNLCFPVVVVEPVMDRIGSEFTFSGTRVHQSADARQRIEEVLSEVEVSVTAYLSGSKISVGELMALRTGDVLRLDNHVQDQERVIISVGGKPKFFAKIGRMGAKEALQIVSVIDS